MKTLLSIGVLVAVISWSTELSTELLCWTSEPDDDLNYCQFTGAKIDKNECKKRECNVEPGPMKVCFNATYWVLDEKGSLGLLILSKLGCAGDELEADCSIKEFTFDDESWGLANGKRGAHKTCKCITDNCNGVGFPLKTDKDGFVYGTSAPDGTSDGTSNKTSDGTNTTSDGVPDGSSLTMEKKPHLIITFLVGAILLH